VPVVAALRDDAFLAGGRRDRSGLAQIHPGEQVGAGNAVGRPRLRTDIGSGQDAAYHGTADMVRRDANDRGGPLDRVEFRGLHGAP